MLSIKAMTSETDLTLVDYFAIIGLDKNSGLRVGFSYIIFGRKSFYAG